MGRKLKGTYRGGSKSERMLAGEDRSRETNHCPLRKFSSLTTAVDQLGNEYGVMHLECGHFGGNFYSQDTAHRLIAQGKRMRCRACAGLD